VGELNGMVALDLLPMDPVEGVHFIQGDFREEGVLASSTWPLDGPTVPKKVDVVVSDMAPNLSGVARPMQRASTHLVELAVDFARQHLKPDGALVVKAVPRQWLQRFAQTVPATFRVVKPFKPKASRDKSSETFLVGMGLK
jgi:23S rRNA (uridine2552-2'-O)-methyltransferase